MTGHDREMDESIAEAAESLRDEHGFVVDVEDRTLQLVQPVKGDLGNAVLRVLALVEGAAPVGAAARGPSGVAAAVWRNPDLYLARWTKGRLWVVGYRLIGSSRPSDHVRLEGRIPTRLETGHWYGTVPDEVGETFLEVGLLLDEPPFPVPPPTTLPSPSPPPSRPPSRSKPPPGAARPPKAPRKVEPRRAATTRGTPPLPRVCPECRMHKAPTQFVAGSDRCVDCR